MKHILLLLFLAPFITYSQSDSLLYGIFPMKEGKICYEKVVNADSATKETLHTRAKTWAVSNFKSQKDALQIDDKEAGMLVYKGFISQPYTVSELGLSSTFTWNYWETVKILLKDNRAKIIVSDFEVKQDGAGSFTIEGFSEYLDRQYGNKFKKYRDKAEKNSMDNFKQANMQIIALINSLESHLSGKTKSDFDF